MPTYWKITNCDMRTRIDYQYKLGEWHQPLSGEKVGYTVKPDLTRKLCSEFWLHFFINPHIGIVHNLNFGIDEYKRPLRLFSVEVDPVYTIFDNLKGGTFLMKLIEEYKVPEIDYKNYREIVHQIGGWQYWNNLSTLLEKVLSMTNKERQELFSLLHEMWPLTKLQTL